MPDFYMFPLKIIEKNGDIFSVCSTDKGLITLDFCNETLLKKIHNKWVHIYFSYIAAPEILEFEPVGKPSDIW